MTRALPRTPAPRAPLHSARLIRFLAENAMIEAVPAGAEVGQRLGDWLNFRQAIALHGLLNPEPMAAAPTPVRSPTILKAEGLRQHVQKIRVQLEQSLTQTAPAGSGLMPIEMPPAEWAPSAEPQTAFEPYRRYMAAHQRQMESVVRTLRTQVRGQLAKSSPALQQLAALDAGFENILSEREAVLLGKVSRLLEKRFVRALKQHLQQQAKATALGEPQATGAAATAWLRPWRQALRNALLAELDLRLQPTLGLLEAFTQENTSP